MEFNKEHKLQGEREISVLFWKNSRVQQICAKKQHIKLYILNRICVILKNKNGIKAFSVAMFYPKYYTRRMKK